MKSVKINFLIHDDIVEAQFKDFISSAFRNHRWIFPVQSESLFVKEIDWEWKDNTVYVFFAKEGE